MTLPYRTLRITPQGFCPGQIRQVINEEVKRLIEEHNRNFAISYDGFAQSDNVVAAKKNKGNWVLISHVPIGSQQYDYNFVEINGQIVISIFSGTDLRESRGDKDIRVSCTRQMEDLAEFLGRELMRVQGGVSFRDPRFVLVPVRDKQDIPQANLYLAYRFHQSGGDTR